MAFSTQQETLGSPPSAGARRLLPDPCYWTQRWADQDLGGTDRYVISGWDQGPQGSHILIRDGLLTKGCGRDRRTRASSPPDLVPRSLTLGLLLLNLSGHQDVVRDLSFTPSGSLILVSASRDKTLRIWDLNKHGMEVEG